MARIWGEQNQSTDVILIIRIMSSFPKQETIISSVTSGILSNMDEPIVIEPFDGVKPMEPICTKKYEIFLEKPDKSFECLQKKTTETPKIVSKVKSIKVNNSYFQKSYVYSL